MFVSLLYASQPPGLHEASGKGQRISSACFCLQFSNTGQADLGPHWYSGTEIMTQLRLHVEGSCSAATNALLLQYECHLDTEAAKTNHLAKGRGLQWPLACTDLGTSHCGLHAPISPILMMHIGRSIRRTAGHGRATKDGNCLRESRHPSQMSMQALSFHKNLQQQEVVVASFWCSSRLQSR